MRGMTEQDYRNYHRRVTMEDTDMNDLEAVRRKLDSLRIRLEARDFKNVMEEAAMRVKAKELYERCKVIAPQDVARYEALVKIKIMNKAKKDVKKAMRQRRFWDGC